MIATLTVESFNTAPVSCYACDEDATGVADRTHDAEGAMVPACARHSHRGIKLSVARKCIYCSKAWTRRSPSLDGDCIHQHCHDAECC